MRRRPPSLVPRRLPFFSLRHPLCTVQPDPQFFAALVCPGEMRMPGMQLPLLLAQPGEPGESHVSGRTMDRTCLGESEIPGPQRQRLANISYGATRRSSRSSALPLTIVVCA